MASSPFLHPGSHTRPHALTILHLRRDNQIPTILSPTTDAITNTRFGSYPHSTLTDIPWGAQVPASKITAGNRPSKKRKREGDASGIGEADGERMDLDDEGQATPSTNLEQGDAAERDVPNRDSNAKKLKAPAKAPSGFCHILPPTPESWTVSLPHRTQVVYTPDYSFVLQKLRVRPGSVLIEAGAGSGSFTHAAARAVFNGAPPLASASALPQRPTGHVYSYEYHAQRADKLRDEITAHGLAPLVSVTHRDVYADGFLLPAPPLATAIFLDLPDPALALPHLARHPPAGRASPLDPARAAHLACFLPCIEQVTRTVEALRRHAWTAIQMVELAQRRLDTRREQVGLHLEGLRGVTAAPASVAESVQRLREVESRQVEFNEGEVAEDGAQGDEEEGGTTGKKGKGRARRPAEPRESKAERLARLAREAEGRKAWREGRLVSRTEPELKTHTSYLVFAVLPREWTEADERAAQAKWGS